MKDFNGTLLEIGDSVAFIEPYSRVLTQGQVVSFTAKQIRVEFIPQCRRDPMWCPKTYMMPDTCLREPCAVAKIERMQNERQMHGL